MESMNANIGLSPMGRTFLAIAAAGNLAAQRALAEEHLRTSEIASNADGLPLLAAVEALLWSRMAAAHGNEGDGMRLSAALTTAAREAGELGLTGVAHNLATEGIAVLRFVAAGGHEPAQRLLESVVHDLAPAVVQQSTAILEEACRAQTHSVAPPSGA